MDNVQAGTSSSAAGEIIGSYNTETNFLSFVARANGCNSAVTMSHIHQAPAGKNGGVVFNLGTGETTEYQYIVDFTETLTDEQEIALLSGDYYVNVHTEDVPSGEIRGQLAPVPEPATMAALGMGLLALAVRRKRK